jgi:hypothetical protein
VGGGATITWWGSGRPTAVIWAGASVVIMVGLGRVLRVARVTGEGIQLSREVICRGVGCTGMQRPKVAWQRSQGKICRNAVVVFAIVEAVLQHADARVKAIVLDGRQVEQRLRAWCFALVAVASAVHLKVIQTGGQSIDVPIQARPAAFEGPSTPPIL